MAEDLTQDIASLSKTERSGSFLIKTVATSSAFAGNHIHPLICAFELNYLHLSFQITVISGFGKWVCGEGLSFFKKFLFFSEIFRKDKISDGYSNNSIGHQWGELHLFKSDFLFLLFIEGVVFISNMIGERITLTWLDNFYALPRHLQFWNFTGYLWFLCPLVWFNFNLTGNVLEVYIANILRDK